MARSPIYTDRWRDAVRPGVIASASALVPRLMDWFAPSSVVDVGCGEGWFCKEFADAGVFNPVGLDGEYVGERAPGDWTFITTELARPVGTGNQYRLAVSLEVAEHLPAERAASFVADLCSLAPLVVFSAAVPGQGGEGHVNERWPGYWRDLFTANGYEGTGAFRWEVWDDDRIGWWYRQNLLVFGTVDTFVEHSIRPDPCHAVIHPGAWVNYRHAKHLP